MPQASAVLELHGILSLHEIPDWLCGFENVIRATFDLVVCRKWDKFSSWGELSL